MRNDLLLALAAGIALRHSALAQPSPSPAPPETYGAWGVDLAARDEAVKPGDDFDSYASGAWAAKTTIPADQAGAGVWDDVYNRAQDQLRALIEGSPRTNQIGALDGSFMDETRVGSLGAKPLEADLTSITKVENKDDFAKIMGRTDDRFGASLYSITVEPDTKRPDLNVMWIYQAGLGLPDRDYYLVPTFKPQLEAYRAFIERALTMIKYADPAGSAAAVIDLETRIAKVSWPIADRREVEKINNPMTLAGLKTYAPGFPWEAFLTAARVTHTDHVLVAEKSAIQAIAAVYAETPLATWKTWETFRTISEASPYLAKPFVDSRFNFTKTISGVTDLRPRWKRGVSLVDESLGELVGRAYVDKYFPPASKIAMQDMVGHLKKAMAHRITNSTWMSPATKKEALTKLSRMDVMVGYPDKWRDYTKLKIDPNDLFGNVERSNAFDWAYHLADLGKTVDRKKWDMTPQTVNAYNGGLENKIVFPAGILQAPFFSPTADPAVNYGSIGAVIGHEISHGFDDQGRKIDATGAVRDWWTSDDAKHFEAQAANFGKQYDSYEPVKGMHINGRLTMGENIADFAGVLVALDAYHDSLGGKTAPVLEGFTGEQRFFLAFAQTWRGKQRDDALRAQIASNEHSPEKYRVIGPLRNVDAWYDAFKIPPDAKYFLKPDDRTRIW